jgi:hypothetical protein
MVFTNREDIKPHLIGKLHFLDQIAKALAGKFWAARRHIGECVKSDFHEKPLPSYETAEATLQGNRFVTALAQRTIKSERLERGKLR